MPVSFLRGRTDTTEQKGTAQVREVDSTDQNTPACRGIQQHEGDQKMIRKEEKAFIAEVARDKRSHWTTAKQDIAAAEKVLEGGITPDDRKRNKLDAAEAARTAKEDAALRKTGKM